MWWSRFFRVLGSTQECAKWILWRPHVPRIAFLTPLPTVLRVASLIDKPIERGIARDLTIIRQSRHQGSVGMPGLLFEPCFEKSEPAGGSESSVAWSASGLRVCQIR